MVRKFRDFDVTRDWRGVVRFDIADVKAALETNKRNRQRKISAILQYRRAMETGTWFADETLPLTWDWNGCLTNGQHRLVAALEAIESGQVDHVDFWCVFGKNPALFSVIDLHQARTLHERVQFPGLLTPDDARYAAAIVNNLNTMQTGTPIRMNADEALSVFNRYADIIPVVARSYNAKKNSGTFSAPVCSALVEYIDRHPDQGREFLSEYENDATHNHACIMLQKRMLDMRASARQGTQRYKYSVTISACRAHRDGVDLKTLKPGTWDSKPSQVRLAKQVA
jgi:hypothetical protein